MVGDKKSRTVIEDKKNRSVKGMEDQWLGELQWYEEVKNFYDKFLILWILYNFNLYQFIIFILVNSTPHLK